MQREQLDGLTVGPATVKLYYRTVHIPYREEADPLRVVPGTGRWPSSRTLYTASSDDVAWAEFCRNHAADIEAADMTGGIGIDLSSLQAMADFGLGPPVPSRSLYELTFRFTQIVDLTTDAAWAVLADADFDVADFFSDTYGECPALAEHGVERGWEALRVPSAAWRSKDACCIPVFPAGFPRLEGVRIVEASAVPTIRVSVGTSYRLGERPSWMLAL